MKEDPATVDAGGGADVLGTKGPWLGGDGADDLGTKGLWTLSLALQEETICPGFLQYLQMILKLFLEESPGAEALGAGCEAASAVVEVMDDWAGVRMRSRISSAMNSLMASVMLGSGLRCRMFPRSVSNSGRRRIAK